MNIQNVLADRILVLDGAMGTMIQQEKLEESDFRGTIFANWHLPLKGNNDILSLTKPLLIQKIHEAYLDAGADIIETNTFNANRISMADYGLEDEIYALNYAAAQIARKAVENKSNKENPKWIAGSIGPTNKTASMSSRVDEPIFREVSFVDLTETYKEQAIALIDGGVDILLIETIFDTLNAKAAILGIQQAFEETKKKLPIMISGTITDASGRTLSGQTAEAFMISVQHANPLSIGFNCALGADMLMPYIKTLSDNFEGAISMHPNAGLPNAIGIYDESPTDMASKIKIYLDQSWLNIVGGCCGTTPAHIRIIADLVKNYKPRVK